MADVEVTIDGIDDVISELKKFSDDMRGMVKAGIIENSRNYTEVIEYAPIQEFGGQIKVTPKMRGYLAFHYDIHLKPTTTHITIPSRPFMRTTYEKHAEEWFDIIAKYLEQGVAAEVILHRVGSRMVDDIVDTINSNMPPELSEITKKIKKIKCPENADKTLYATGQLAHSIHYEVFPDAESA